MGNGRGLRERRGGGGGVVDWGDVRWGPGDLESEYTVARGLTRVRIVNRAGWKGRRREGPAKFILSNGLMVRNVEDQHTRILKRQVRADIAGVVPFHRPFFCTRWWVVSVLCMQITRSLKITSVSHSHFSQTQSHQGSQHRGEDTGSLESLACG